MMERILEHIVAQEKIVFPCHHGNIGEMYQATFEPGYDAYGLCRKGGRFSIGAEQLDMVLWEANKIAIYPLSPGWHAISFQFTGCIMAVFCWKGCWYAAHVSTSTDTEADCKRKWIRFVKAEGITSLTMFRPDSGFKPSECTEDLYTWGVISDPGRTPSPDWQCYSVYAEYVGTDYCDLRDFRVCYIRQHRSYLSVRDYDRVLNPPAELLDDGHFKGLCDYLDDFWDERPGDVIYDRAHVAGFFPVTPRRTCNI